MYVVISLGLEVEKTLSVNITRAKISVEPMARDTSISASGNALWTVKALCALADTESRGDVVVSSTSVRFHHRYA